MRIDADNRTAGHSGDSQSGTSCSTSDIEQNLPGSKVKPVEKPVLLVCGQPAILTNVFAKRFTTYLSLGAAPDQSSNVCRMLTKYPGSIFRGRCFPLHA